MKPVIHTDRNITSNLQGETIEMGFDEKSLPHLMRRFIDLYKDREMAVLREYACNARDSHVAAGNPDPIRVTLPSKFNPVLTIADQGVGLSVDELREIWSKYGASTKRDSNEEIGSFGLGSKSALTYTDQFTVQAVKDGTEALVSIAFNAKGIGELTVVAEQDTDKPNGVQIAIPARYPDNQFADRAARLFQWWPKGSVLVDEIEPVSFLDQNGPEYHEVVPNIYLQEVTQRSYDQREQSLLIMGGVPYPVTIDELGLDFGWHHRYEQRVVAFVDIGTVEPVPSREGLTDTQSNKDALHAVGAQVTANAKMVAQKEIDGASDLYEAIEVIERLQRSMPPCFQPLPYKWCDEEVPTGLRSSDIPDDPYANGGWLVVPVEGRGSRSSRQKKLNWNEIQQVFYFTDFDVETFTAVHRRRLKQWLVNNVDTIPSIPRQVALCQTVPDSPLVRKERVFNWSEVRDTKLPRKARLDNGRLQGSYDKLIVSDTRYRAGVNEIQAQAIDQSKPLYFWCGNESKARWERSRAEKAKPVVAYLQQDNPDATFLAIPETRRAKLERQFPHAKEMREEIAKRRDRFVTRLSLDEQFGLHLHSYEDRRYQLLVDPDLSLLDPELIRAQKLMKLDLGKLQGACYEFEKLGFGISLAKFDPLDKYPLLAAGLASRYTAGEDVMLMQHIGTYLNAAYTELVKG